MYSEILSILDKNRFWFGPDMKQNNLVSNSCHIQLQVGSSQSVDYLSGFGALESLSPMAPFLRKPVSLWCPQCHFSPLHCVLAAVFFTVRIWVLTPRISSGPRLTQSWPGFKRSFNSYSCLIFQKPGLLTPQTVLPPPPPITWLPSFPNHVWCSFSSPKCS